jgi:taurine dioxygenase
MLNLERLPGGFGARILGLDLSAALDEFTAGRIRDALYRHQVIVVPQQALKPDQFIDFARRFGQPVPHVLSQLRLLNFPEILPLSNIFENGKPNGVYDGAVFWHTDMSYEDPPGAATLVYSIKAPKTGGDTRFADMYRAYDTLSEALKRRVDDLLVLHPPATSPATQRYLYRISVKEGVAD